MSGFTLKPEGREQEQALPSQVGLINTEGKLSDLDLDAELYAAFAQAKNLYTEVQYDDTTKTTEKVANIKAMADILGRITSMQSAVFSLQRVKALEECLVKTLKEFPDIQDAFLTKYREALEKLDG